MDRLRRPGTGTRSAARRSERARASTRRVAGTGPAAPSGGLTARAAALGLVLCVLVVMAALPLREYLAQRGRIADLEQQRTAQQQRVVALEQQRALLADPAYVASLARSRLHYVAPGETTYVVLDPTGSSAPEGPSGATGAARPEQGPWWSQLWGSVQSGPAPGAGG